MPKPRLLVEHACSRVRRALTAGAAAACLVFPTAAPQASAAAPTNEAKIDAGKVKDKAEVTFSGYQTLPGNRGVIFVELTAPVAVEVSRSGQVIEYRLVGATVPLKNNTNPLLLRDFGASAVTAQLIPDKADKRRGKKSKGADAKRTPGVRLVISLRGNVTPSHRMVQRGKGAALEVELPPPGDNVP